MPHDIKGYLMPDSILILPPRKIVRMTDADLGGTWLYLVGDDFKANLSLKEIDAEIGRRIEELNDDRSDREDRSDKDRELQRDESADSTEVDNLGDGR